MLIVEMFYELRRAVSDCLDEVLEGGSDDEVEAYDTCLGHLRAAHRALGNLDIKNPPQGDTGRIAALEAKVERMVAQVHRKIDGMDSAVLNRLNRLERDITEVGDRVTEIQRGEE